ncbi:aminopeptidase P family protein [bacterium]|nr:aminopeptidase P family protein [bacterium]
MEIRDFIPKRFEKLAEQLNNNEAVILFSNDPVHGVNRFEQDKNFLYFTGLEIANARLVVVKNSDKLNSTLYIERNIPERIVWDGAKMYPEEATEISTIKNVQFTDLFEANITTIMAFNGVRKVYCNYQIGEMNKPLDSRLFFAEELKKRVPGIEVGDFTDIVRPLRQIKDEFELEQLQYAIDVTGQGLDEIFNYAEAGMFEFELEAMLYNEMLSSGFRFWGFTPIIASGKNAATLHYIDNDTEIDKDTMVLCDVGASSYGYSADITRTFPIGEKFTPRAKEVYQEVLAIQKEIIEMIKPGVSMMQLNDKTNELITKACHKLGLIKEDSEFRKYYMHSIGHHLGLDTHDVGARNSNLEAGMVITIEPGLYIPEESIGVRIEDDILVTESGYKVLSGAIPKEVSELEAIRKASLHR